MWIWPTRPSDTTTSASTGASETKILKYWMVPRASLLRGKIQLRFVSVSSSEVILKNEQIVAEMWDKHVVPTVWIQSSLTLRSDVRSLRHDTVYVAYAPKHKLLL